MRKGLKMPNITIIKANPNPKSAILSVDADLLGSYSRVIIPKKSDIRQFSPLAEMIFNLSQTVVRIDFSFQEGATVISVARKPLDFKPEEVEALSRRISEFFESGQKAILLEALAGVEARKPFEPKNPVEKLVVGSFNAHVNPITIRDGGSIEVLKVNIAPDGKICTDVALIGQCNGCGSAITDTLGGAKNAITAEFNILKERHASNPNVQKLQFEDITPVELPSLVFIR